MDERRYPTPETSHLVEHLNVLPPGVRARRWVLRDDNRQHYHGVVRLSDGPTYVELWWKQSTGSREQLVDRYRLHTIALLSAGQIRAESEERGDEIRLRFYRGSGGIVSVQSRAAGPTLPVRTVRLQRAVPNLAPLLAAK